MQAPFGNIFAEVAGHAMFKVDFKFYKSKRPVPDLSAVVDVKENFAEQKRIIPAADFKATNTFVAPLGLTPVEDWKICELHTNPGLIFIANPFTTEGQRYWISRCLRDYTRKPNRLNIDTHTDIGGHGDDWWETCHKDGAVNEILLKKLRWATMGYHHNWDTKVYSEDACDLFPVDLRSLCEFVARVVGFHCFTAQAAIVNFYHMDSTLSGHTDHSEANREAPLLSFSFGQSAIFLLGGQTLDDKPSAILVESGDIIIMSGQSRLCYHGVPRILPASKIPWIVEDRYCNKEVKSDKCGGNSREGTVVSADSNELGINLTLANDCSNEMFWNPFCDYLRTSRINLNVRQVLLSGESHM